MGCRGPLPEAFRAGRGGQNTRSRKVWKYMQDSGSRWRPCGAFCQGRGPSGRQVEAGVWPCFLSPPRFGPQAAADSWLRCRDPGLLGGDCYLPVPFTDSGLGLGCTEGPLSHCIPVKSWVGPGKQSHL